MQATKKLNLIPYLQKLKNESSKSPDAIKTKNSGSPDVNKTKNSGINISTSLTSIKSDNEFTF